MTPPAVSARPSEARDRLLATASGLFYAKGVHAVGTEEIISTAQVTRATFYRHFPSKDDLIVEYLRTADLAIRAAVAAAVAEDSAPGSAVRGIASVVAGQIGTPGFRGCAFLNAAAEYPDPDDPIHQAILTHRAWFRDAVHDAFAQVTDRAPQATAHFVMLRDGAMAEGCLSDPRSVIDTFLAGIDGMLATFPAVQDSRRSG
ncbi:TetR/AcrR family transcriptional regulator [Jatrophihabitans sp. YIM 134969]